MSIYLTSLRLRHGSRAAAIFLTFWLVVAVVFSLFRSKTGVSITSIAGGSPTTWEETFYSQAERLAQCGRDQDGGRAGTLKAIEMRFRPFSKDKFTFVMLSSKRLDGANKTSNDRIVISTFQRPKELNNTLTILTTTKIPSLLEIVVVWNNIGEAPPDPTISEHGVKVRYRASTKNSLNEKLRIDTAYQTRAIFLSDDDVHFQPSDLEFAFQMWREFGRDRITGALPRCCSFSSSTNAWEYNFCENGEIYNLVLTNLAFVDISFLDYYSSEDAQMVQIREYVDKVFNCEDIALNFVVSMLTCSGPLLVRGRNPHVNYDPQAGLSRNPGHMETRSKCLNEFSEILNLMPLVDESGHVVRGLIP
jgi:Glycosyl transferase family 64 domain